SPASAFGGRRWPPARGHPNSWLANPVGKIKQATIKLVAFATILNAVPRASSRSEASGCAPSVARWGCGRSGMNRQDEHRILRKSVRKQGDEAVSLTSPRG